MVLPFTALSSINSQHNPGKEAEESSSTYRWEDWDLQLKQESPSREFSHLESRLMISRLSFRCFFCFMVFHPFLLLWALKTTDYIVFILKWEDWSLHSNPDMATPLPESSLLESLSPFSAKSTLQHPRSKYWSQKGRRKSTGHCLDPWNKRFLTSLYHYYQRSITC